MSGKAQLWPSRPGRPLAAGAIVLGGVLVCVLGVTALAVLLYFYGGGSPQDQAGLDAVRTAGALVAGTGGGIALLLAARRQRSTELALEHQREIAVQQRITELYTRAVDQLGNHQAPVRLGGLCVLERLAQNNPAQRQTIVDVICAYLRMPYTPPENKMPAEDVAEAIYSRDEQRSQELQVRLTAQRILAAHLRADAADAFWAGIDLDLTEAYLFKLDMADCHIRSARFEGARFSGYARFDRARFSGDAGFDRVRFFGAARFGGVRFSGDARFGGARFSGYAGFDGAQFSGFAWFGGARFSGDAWFGGTRFSGYAGFDGARFSGYGWFGGARFSGDAGFDGARALPAENHRWPVRWTTCEAVEEAGWLDVVPVADSLE